MSLNFRIKDILDSTVEVASKFEREFQRWIVSPSFDCVDGLPTHSDSFRKVALAKIHCVTPLREVILHCSVATFNDTVTDTIQQEHR